MANLILRKLTNSPIEDEGMVLGSSNGTSENAQPLTPGMDQVFVPPASMLQVELHPPHMPVLWTPLLSFDVEHQGSLVSEPSLVQPL